MDPSTEMTIAFSEIDSDRFGVRIARAHLGSGSLPPVLQFCISQQIDLLIARCLTTEFGTVHQMSEAGFLLMDALVYYAFDLSRRPIPDESPKVQIRTFRPEDKAQVQEVAAASFQGYFGHYHADPRLDRKKSDEGYTSWAVRSCVSKEVADEVLIAEREGRVVGFATLRINSPQEGEGVLFGVAPEAQGLGIYRSFMLSGMQWCKKQGVQRMVVSTQITNIAVQKVWCRVGFEPSHSYYTFHKWFTAGGNDGAASSGTH
jgi:GNAT superfamily N-acetyltransferase